MIIMILIAIVILLLIWGIATYNRLITEQLKVQNQWSQIDVVLKQRFDLIPNLLETVKGYAAYEKEALQAVTDARSRYLSAADTEADKGQHRAVRRCEPSHGSGGVLPRTESKPEFLTSTAAAFRDGGKTGELPPILQ